MDLLVKLLLKAIVGWIQAHPNSPFSRFMLTQRGPRTDVGRMSRPQRLASALAFLLGGCLFLGLWLLVAYVTFGMKLVSPDNVVVQVMSDWPCSLDAASWAAFTCSCACWSEHSYAFTDEAWTIIARSAPSPVSRKPEPLTSAPRGGGQCTIWASGPRGLACGWFLGELATAPQSRLCSGTSAPGSRVLVS